MSHKTVRQLADIEKKPLVRLLEQYQETDLSAKKTNRIINGEQRDHSKYQGAGDNAPSCVTLERRKVTEIKQANVPSSSTKTISVEVCKKETYMNRPEPDETKTVKPVGSEPEESKTPASNIISEAVPVVEITDAVVEQTKCVPQEPSLTTPDVPADDIAEATPPHDIVESETVKTDKTIFVIEYLLDTSCFKHEGFSVFTPPLNNPVPKDYYQQHTDATFVLAFDNTDNGIDCLQKTIDCFKSLGIENYKLALPPQNRTWLSLNFSGQLAADTLEKTLNEAYLQGELFFAESALDYFNRYRKQHPDTTTLIFEFNKCLYKGYLTKAKASSDTEPAVTQLTDCRIQLIDSVTDESRNDTLEHHLELYSEREGRNRITLTDAQLRRLNAFKKALQQHRYSFDGNSKDLDDLVKYLFEANPPKVRALSAIGYDPKSQRYVFPEFIYSVDGNRSPIFNRDTSDGIPLPPIDVKPFIGCSDTIIKTNGSTNVSNIMQLLGNTYGYKGVLAFGFYVSSLFSHKVYEQYGFFPILSLYGNPSPYIDDKKFLSRLFNRCLFIDSEGQKMKAAFTAESELKKIRQKSNLVCALLDDRTYKNLFDYDTVLPFYNRKTLSSHATLAFVSSNERFTNEVIRDFVISLHFPNTVNNQPNSAWNQLNQHTPEQLSSVGHYLLSNRQWFENGLINKITTYEGSLKNSGITTPRMAQNYAIALGGIVCLLELLNSQQYIDSLNNAINGLLNYTIQRAKHKQESTNNPVRVADYFLSLILEHCNQFAQFLLDDELLIDLPVTLRQLAASDFDFNEKTLSTGLKQHPQYLSYEKSVDFGTTRNVYFFKNVQCLPFFKL
jgi:hypothetical protein